MNETFSVEKRRIYMEVSYRNWQFCCPAMANGRFYDTVTRVSTQPWKCLETLQLWMYRLKRNFESFPSHLSIVQVNVETWDVNTKFSKYHHTIWEANKVFTGVINLLKGIMNSFTTRNTRARCTRHALHRARAPRNHMSTKPIERMHSRAQQSCKFIGTKEVLT